MVVDTTHCLVAGAILLGKEELNIVSWTGEYSTPHYVGMDVVGQEQSEKLIVMKKD